MFVTVLHGDNEEVLFNIQCKVQLLLESIKRACHCEPEGFSVSKEDDLIQMCVNLCCLFPGGPGDIELADENGHVKNLLENQHCYAFEILSERETYVPLAVSRPAGTSEPVFTPLLNDEAIINPKFLAKLGNWGESKSSGSRTKSKKTSKKSVVISTSAPDGKPSPQLQGKSKAAAPNPRKRAGKP